MTSAAPPPEGSLAQHSVQTLLETYAQGRSSGRLTVRTPVGEAQVKLLDGAVTEARFGPVEGDNALLRLLSFAEGTFSFEAVQPSLSGAATSSMQELMRKAAQRRVDLAHYAEHLGGMEQRFALDLGALNALDHDLRRDLGNVLSLVDGRRSVQELVAVTDIDDVTVLRVLKKLRAMRVIKTQAELEADRLAKQAPPPPPPRAPSLEDQLLAQASAREEERQSLIEMAVPDALRSTPPATEANRQERQGAAEAFAASVTTPPPAPALPAVVVAAAPAPVVAAVEASPPPVVPPPAAPPPVVAPPQQHQHESLASTPAAFVHPQDRRATPPAGMPVHATPVHLPSPTAHPDSARPGKLPREDIKLPVAKVGERADPRLARWTDRPTRGEEEDGLEYALDRRASPLGGAPPAAGTPTPGGPAGGGPHPTPVVNMRVDFPDIGDRVTPVVALPAVGAPPIALGAGMTRPDPPASRKAAEPAAAHDDHDEAFFARAADTSELQALAEQDAASAREAQSQRLMGYVALGVGAVAVAILTVIWSAGGDAPEEPAIAVPQADPTPPKPPTPNVVIPDMGAQVRTGTEAAHDLLAQPDPAGTAASTETQRSPAALAAELAAATSTQPPPAAAVSLAAVPPPPASAAAPTPEKPPVAVAEKPMPAPAPPKAAPPAPAPEKPAPVPEDPKRLFADRFERGKRLLDQGRYEEAKKAFESALKFDPGSARAYTQLGRANYELGNMDEALRLLRKAEALEPAHAYTYLVMGLVQQERGDLPNAERAYEKYLTLDAASANARAVQGFLKGLRAQRAAKKGG